MNLSVRKRRHGLGRCRYTAEAERRAGRTRADRRQPDQPTTSRRTDHELTIPASSKAARGKGRYVLSPPQRNRPAFALPAAVRVSTSHLRRSGGNQGHGNARLYSPRDLVCFELVRRLSEAGVAIVAAIHMADQALGETLSRPERAIWPSATPVGALDALFADVAGKAARIRQRKTAAGNSRNRAG